MVFDKTRLTCHYFDSIWFITHMFISEYTEIRSVWFKQDGHHHCDMNIHQYAYGENGFTLIIGLWMRANMPRMRPLNILTNGGQGINAFQNQ